MFSFFTSGTAAARRARGRVAVMAAAAFTAGAVGFTGALYGLWLLLFSAVAAAAVLPVWERLDRVYAAAAMGVVPAVARLAVVPDARRRVQDVPLRRVLG